MRDAEAISKILGELIRDAEDIEGSLLAYILRAAKIEAEDLAGRKNGRAPELPLAGVIVPFGPRK